MKLKKISAFLLSLAVMLSAFSAASAAEKKPMTVLVNGTAVQTGDWQPVVEKGTTFVPMRPLFSQLGIKLDWNGQTQTVTGTKDNLTFTIKIGSPNATVNGQPKTLAAAPRAIRDSAYVPLRFIGEAAGYKVGWNSAASTITLDSAEAQSAGSTGFLWKTEKNGNTVYLLGSIHVANEAMYPLRPEIEAAFKASDYLGVEVDMSKLDQAAMQKLVQSTGVYSDGTTLKDHVSADTYGKVVAILKGRGLPENSFDTFKPWVVAQTIPSLQMIEAGYQSDLGIDMYFMQNAAKQNKPIVQLETAEEQLGMFNGFSAGLQEEILLEAINAYNNPSQSAGTAIDEMSKMWVEGDEEALVGLTKATAAKPEYYKALVADRNAGMLKKIEGYLNGEEKKSYFIVVGALHMLGDDGLVTKLRSDGFEVEKL